MEEFIDIYRYLTKCYTGLDKLEREKIELFLHKISDLVTTEKTGPALIGLMLEVTKRSADEGEIDNGLNVIMPAILEIEDKFSNSDNSSNETKGDISDNPGRAPIFDKKTVLRSFGACKVYAKIFDYIFAKLDTKFRTPDIAILIKKYYNDVLKRQLAQSSSVTYAGCYVKYMYEKGLIIDHGFGVYSKKTNETKETKELKKFGEKINGNGKKTEEPSAILKTEHEEKLLDKFKFGKCPECGGRMVKTGIGYKNAQRVECVECGKKVTESFTVVKENNTEFEDFQKRILEAAESNGWNQVAIETIEETFKGTKSEEQVQKALGQLLVKEEKIIQMPPTPSDILDAKKNDRPKPKGYIIFKKK